MPRAGSPDRWYATLRTLSQSMRRRSIALEESWRRKLRREYAAPAAKAPAVAALRQRSERKAELMRSHRAAGAAIDVDRVLRRLALEPVGVQLGLRPPPFAQKGFVEDLAACERWRLGAQDLHHGVAEDVRRAPLAAVTQAPVDARQRLDDGHRPQRVAGDTVALVLRGNADGEASHAHLRRHVCDVARARLGADRRRAVDDVSPMLLHHVGQGVVRTEV